MPMNRTRNSHIQRRTSKEHLNFGSLRHSMLDVGCSRLDVVHCFKHHSISVRFKPGVARGLQSFGVHRHWKRRLVGLAKIRPGERALDLCCGTGDVAFALARKGAKVTGLDFSEPMLAVACDRLKAQMPKFEPDGRVKFVCDDAQQIPFPDNSFDLVTISYGLRNLADWEKGLREMRRVANPGGRLLVLDFGK